MNGTITRHKFKNRRNGLVETWGYKFRVRQADGKTWRWVSKKGFETRREAQAAQRQALIDAGLRKESELDLLPVPDRVPTFQQELDQFLSDASVECTLGTLEAYRKQSRYPSRGVRSSSDRCDHDRRPAEALQPSAARRRR